MKAIVSYGLLGLMIVGVLGLGARGCGSVAALLFNDELMICSCGCKHVEFRPSQGPPGSTQGYYRATCKMCEKQWEVVDVAWNDPRKVIDATIEAATHEPEDPNE
jgi:hypothetical protein